MFVVSLEEGLEIDVSKVMIMVIYKRDFKTSTTYPFSCKIFLLHREVGVPIWHFHTLHHPTMIVDICLIMDEANVAAPHRGPKIVVPPLSENLVETVELALGADHTTLDPADTTSNDSIHAASRSPAHPNLHCHLDHLFL